MFESTCRRTRKLKEPAEPLRSMVRCAGISGLSDVSARLEAVPDIAVVRLAERDIVRHPLVASMIGVL